MNTRQALQRAAHHLNEYAEELRDAYPFVAEENPYDPELYPFEAGKKSSHDEMVAIAQHLLSLVGKPVAQIKAEAAWPFPTKET